MSSLHLDHLTAPSFATQIFRMFEIDGLTYPNSPKLKRVILDQKSPRYHFLLQKFARYLFIDDLKFRKFRLED